MIAAVLAVPVFLFFSKNLAAQSADFNTAKSLEIQYNILKELSNGFVDSVNVEKLVNTGIDAMLGSLDPYTEYIPEEDEQNLALLTTATYGGIGALIKKLDTTGVIISQPYAGSPAVKYGLEPGDVILKINGVQLPEENVKKNIFYQEVSSAQLPYGGSLLSALYLSDETAIYYYQYLEQLQPSFIRGYPYTLYRLAKYAQKYGWQFSFRLKGIQLTSEMIFDYQIEAIEKVFQTKVYMQYGHAEACVFAYTRDEDRKYYCSPLYGHVEVLDKNGKHVKSGEVGEAVVTSYSNYAMPFIRYRTGDMVEYGGNTGGVVILNKVIGRAQNVIYDKHGEDISLVCFVTKGAYHHILKWRVIQKEYGKVIIKIVKGTDYTKEDEEEFREIYQRQGGIEVEFQYVNDIEPSKNGKAVLLEQYLER